MNGFGSLKTTGTAKRIWRESPFKQSESLTQVAQYIRGAQDLPVSLFCTQNKANNIFNQDREGFFSEI
jgi:hypothetical protein